MRLSTQLACQAAHQVLRRPAMRNRLPVKLMVPPVRPHNHPLRPRVPLRIMLAINHPLNRSPRPGQRERQHPLSPSPNPRQRRRQDKLPRQPGLKRLPGRLVLPRQSCNHHRGFLPSRLTLGSQHPLYRPLRTFCRGQTAPRSPGIPLNHHPLRYPCLGRSSGSPPISLILSLNIRGRLQTMHNSLHSQASNACSNGTHSNNSNNNTCNTLPNHHYSQSNKATGSNTRSSLRSSLDRQGHGKSLLRRHQLVNRLLSCIQRL